LIVLEGQGEDEQQKGKISALLATKSYAFGISLTILDSCGFLDSFGIFKNLLEF